MSNDPEYDAYIKYWGDTKPITFYLKSSAGAPVTGVVPVVNLIKNGAAPAVPVGPVIEIGLGNYKLTPDKSDVTTYGELILHASGTGAVDVNDKYRIVGGGISEEEEF